MTSDSRRSDLEARVLATLSGLFGIPPSDLTPSSHMDELPAWDSMGHMELTRVWRIPADLPAPRNGLRTGHR